MPGGNVASLSVGGGGRNISTPAAMNIYGFLKEFPYKVVNIAGEMSFCNSSGQWVAVGGFKWPTSSSLGPRLVVRGGPSDEGKCCQCFSIIVTNSQPHGKMTLSFPEYRY